MSQALRRDVREKIMTTLAVELVWGDKPVTVGDVAQFVAQVRAAGADDGTQLEAAVADDDYHQQVGWRVELGSGAAAPEAEVTLPASIAHNVLGLLNIIAESDGDIRSIGTGVAEARDELLKALLGTTFGVESTDSDD
jgi:hypothetical protein